MRVHKGRQDQRAPQAHRDQQGRPVLRAQLDRKALRANRVPKVIQEPPRSLNNDHRCQSDAPR